MLTLMMVMSVMGDVPLSRGFSHLWVIQSEEGLQVGDQVRVDPLQRLQQRNSCQLSKRLFDL